MANISNKSPLLWIHLVMVYVISIIVMKVRKRLRSRARGRSCGVCPDALRVAQMLWIAQIEAVKWRVRYLASTRKGAESHTILVQDVPGILHGTVTQRIYQVRSTRAQWQRSQPRSLTRLPHSTWTARWASSSRAPPRPRPRR